MHAFETLGSRYDLLMTETVESTSHVAIYRTPFL